MRKLTDEELSRVLSQQAVGLLRHDTFGRTSTDPIFPECGCVAGAVFDIGDGRAMNDLSNDERSLAEAISDAVYPGGGVFAFDPYPSTPEALLAYLAERGLA